VVAVAEAKNNMNKNILTESDRLQKLAGIEQENKTIYMEEEHNSLLDKELMDDVPSVKLYINDHGMMRIQLSSLYHDPSNDKILLLKNNPVLQELVMKAIQMETQKAFRRAVHGVLGKPYGLKQ
jgi:hemerythrin superfamily protein